MNVSNLAFYIGKSSNKNVAIYSYVIADTESNTINLFNPLECYWVMREHDGNPREELTYIEKTMAYGFDIIPDADDSSDNSTIRIKVKALPNDSIRIQKVDGKYQSIVSIPDPKTNEPSDVALKKVFCHVSGPLDNFVESIDFIYEDPKSKKLKTYSRTENKGLTPPH